jgi:hypothetical protein
MIYAAPRARKHLIAAVWELMTTLDYDPASPASTKRGPVR